MKIKLTLLSVFTTMVLSGPAQAADEDWKLDASFAEAKRASIKVVSPKGMKLQFSEKGIDKEDRAPHVIQVADEDAYVPITFIAADGEKYTEKVEVKRGQTSILKAVYTPKPVPPPIYKGRIFFRGQCNAQQVLRVDVLGAKTETKKSFSAKFDSAKEIELPKDAYALQYVMEFEGREVKLAKRKFSPSGDAFVLGFVCSGNGGKVLADNKKK